MSDKKTAASGGSTVGHAHTKGKGCGHHITVCKNCAESGELMSFSHALALMKENPGLRFTRKHWDRRIVEMLITEDGVLVRIEEVHGEVAETWEVQQDDLLREDWSIVK